MEPPVLSARMTFPGLWRGLVVDNDDKSQKRKYLGRIKVSVPQVYGEIEDEDLPWAWPCFPAGGSVEDGVTHGNIMIPRVGASVWVAFEHGDPRCPVWLGLWYGAKDAPIEMPYEARRDPPAGVSYPDIFLVKIPWEIDGKPIYFRCSRDKKAEFIYGDNWFQLDMNNKRALVLTKGLNMQVRVLKGDAAEGEEEGEGGDFLLWAEGDIRIQADGDLHLRAKGDLVTFAEGTARHQALGENRFQSAEAIRGGAPARSGFDNY